MALPSLERFAQKAAEHRSGWFGKAASYESAAFEISRTAVTSRKQLREGGFQGLHDAIGRVVKGAIVFELGKKVTIAGRQYRIDEIRDHPINPEWLLGLKQL